MAADSANALTRARAGLIPTAAPATSLPPRARRKRPVVPARTSITSDPTTTSTATERKKNDRSPAKSIGPSTGRATRGGTAEPPIQSTFTSTFSKKSANASVANVRWMPPNRTAGSARSAPTIAAIAAPASTVTSKGTSNRVDGRERVGRLAAPAETRPEDEQHEQGDEREGRTQPLREQASGRQPRRQQLADDAEQQTSDQGQRQARQGRERRGGDGGDDQQE